MDGWLGYLIAFALLVMVAPLVAWLGRREGRKLKGAAGLAFVMLGFGAVMDPPTHQAMEAVARQEHDDDETGEPKDPTAGH
ncbi:MULTISPECIES: hypothetical protein [unclassified Phenylobacterium]|uniref:hypothetical protein n=1 Tax=unclassified Phenylobacterium TaxID=2640670 RepID=UPI00083AA777|nr:MULTISPECIES: hypothetical protein [unclassified Phenylobacterium]